MDFKNTIPSVDAETLVSTDLLNNQTTTDLDEVIDTKSATEHVEFIFGNGANAAAALIPPSNGNDFKNHHHEAEDSGPETDVDALDEAGAQMSPIEDFISEFVHKNGEEMRSNVVVQHSEFEKDEQLEGETEFSGPKKDYDVTEDEEIAVGVKANNSFFEEEEEIDDKFDSFHTSGHLINDNKFLDTVHEDAGILVNDQDELVESVKKTIDFSEKKEFSFEREEFEKEIDSLADVQSAMQEAFGDEDAHHQDEASSVRSDLVQASPIPLDSSAEDEGIEVNALSDDAVGVPFIEVGESLTVDDLQALSVNDDEEYQGEFLAKYEEHSSFIAPEKEHGKSYIFKNNYHQIIYFWQNNYNILSLRFVLSN